MLTATMAHLQHPGILIPTQITQPGVVNILTQDLGASYCHSPIFSISLTQPTANLHTALSLSKVVKEGSSALLQQVEAHLFQLLNDMEFGRMGAGCLHMGGV